MTRVASGVLYHLTLVQICESYFRNWESPTFTSFCVASLSALPGRATSLLHLSQPRTEISVFIYLCVLEESFGCDFLPFWRAGLLLQPDAFAHP